MDSARLESIKNQVLKERQERIDMTYNEAILHHMKLIQQAPGSRNNLQYFFNILRDYGYLSMTGSDAGKTLIEDVRQLPKVKFVSGVKIPPFVNFDKYPLINDIFKEEMEKHLSTLPQYRGDLAVENEWEEKRKTLFDDGMELLKNGFDINATIHGHELIMKGPTAKTLDDAWVDYFYSAEDYLHDLYSCEKLFYFLSDPVFKQYASFPLAPQNDFNSFIQRIVAPRETYPREIHYRKVLSSEEQKEIYYRVKLKFPDHSSTALTYFYHHALAAETLQGFIIRICLAKSIELKSDPSAWRCITFLDDDIRTEIPMLCAGDIEYLVFMLGPRVSGWGIRKDRIEPTMFDYDGALFCSWKQYPSGEVLVRFDNFVNRADLRQLLDKREDDFTRLTFDEVYKKDGRDYFCQMASDSAMTLLRFAEPKTPDATDIMDTIRKLIAYEDLTITKERRIQYVTRGATKRKLDKGQYRIKDTLELEVEAPGAGHVVVLHYADRPEGISLFFPADPDHDTSVKKSGKKKISGTVSGPIGKHFLKVIWSSSPLINPATVSFDKPEGAIRELVITLTRLDKNEWRTKTYEYEVVK